MTSSGSEKRLWDAYTERLRGCTIDGKVKSCGLLNRKIGWFRPFEYLVDEHRDAAIQT
jgi:hypothetical protein